MMLRNKLLLVLLCVFGMKTAYTKSPTLFGKVNSSLIIDENFIDSLKLNVKNKVDNFNELYKNEKGLPIYEVSSENSNFKSEIYSIGNFDAKGNLKAELLCIVEEDKVLGIISKTISLVVFNEKHVVDFLTLCQKKNVFFDPLENAKINSLLIINKGVIIQNEYGNQVYDFEKGISVEDDNLYTILKSSFCSAKILQSSLMYHKNSFFSLSPDVDLVAVYSLDKNNKALITKKEINNKFIFYCKRYNKGILIKEKKIGEIEYGIEGQLMYFKKFIIKNNIKSISVTTTNLYGESENFDY